MQFVVTYVAAETIYVDGGADEGLAEGMDLEVTRLEPGRPLTEARFVGSVKVIAVASSSAVCSIVSNDLGIAKGDLAALSTADAETVAHLMTSKNSRSYAQIISFTDLNAGDPLEDEQRAYVPRPTLSEVNRVKGRVSMQRSSLFDRTSNTASHQSGGSVRVDMTRIGGTYWNFRGYWRGRLNSRNRGSQTLTDLVNRTYHIGAVYENPYSPNTMGFGRLLLPWASSLSTIDGGYFGRRLGKAATVGVFGGSTPDPTAWNYDPNRQILGVLLELRGRRLRQRSLHRHGRRRPHSAQLASGTAIHVPREHGVRQPALQPVSQRGSRLPQPRALRVRNQRAGAQPQLPDRARPRRATWSPWTSATVTSAACRPSTTRLIGTGLVDQLLFQGLSSGLRNSSAAAVLPSTVNSAAATAAATRLPRGTTCSATPSAGCRGRMCEPTCGPRALAGSFGEGRYHTVSLSREIAEVFRVEVQAGQQDFHGVLTDANRARFVNASLDWFLGAHYYLGFGLTAYRGNVQILRFRSSSTWDTASKSMRTDRNGHPHPRLAPRPLTSPALRSARPDPLEDRLREIGFGVERFWRQIASVSCTETTEQLKLEPRKPKKVLNSRSAVYDYLVFLQWMGARSHRGRIP